MCSNEGCGHAKVIIMALAVAAFSAAPAEVDPLTIDVAAAVECKASTDDLFTLLVLRDNDRDYAGKRGWKAIEGGNVFFSKRYRLPAPITVFGRVTDELAFTNNTIFAVLKNVDPRALGAELRITPDISSATEYLGARIVSDKVEVDPSVGARMRVLVALQMTTMGEPWGDVLAGCSQISQEAE
jgi:hypothetical protein